MPKTKTVKAQGIPTGYTRNQIRTITRTPAGKCPIKLRDLSPTNDLPPTACIIEWFHRVRDWGVENGTYYTADAIAYFVRYEFDPCGVVEEYEHDEVVDTILRYAASIKDWTPAITDDDEE